MGGNCEMRFTYDSYGALLKLLKEHGYEFRSYDDYSESEKCVILRHDIDNDLQKSLRMALLEKSIHDTVEEFVNSGNKYRYKTFLSNITDLGLIMSEEEVR